MRLVYRSLYVCLLFTYNITNAQSLIRGSVMSTIDSLPLPFISVNVQGTNISSITDKNGYFSLSVSLRQGVLNVTALGFKTKQVPFNLTSSSDLRIYLDEDINRLSEINVVSTGYQRISKERATGSFVKIDNELLNRRISTNVLERLEDVTPGLIFNRGKTDQGSIRVRGQNTIYGNASPLIVIDNFPYDGDISNINPNDVENITVLKDAAAASIWGSRAGNGVIVITTKKGNFNRLLNINFNSNVTFSARPNLFYQPRMSSADFIDIEKMLFSNGYYTTAETYISNPALTPVVELLIKKRNDPSLSAQIDSQIEAMKGLDVRNDYKNYLFRNAFLQQQNLSINGGGETHNYFLSAGYDGNTEHLINNNNNRITLNAGNSFSLLNKKLEASLNIYYTKGQNQLNNQGINTIGLNAGSGTSMYPYARLADDDGNALAINHNYRDAFILQAKQAGFLDWTFKPIEEIRLTDNSRNTIDYRINALIKYRISNAFSIETLYQYGHNSITQKNFRSDNSYFTRNMINRFTQRSQAGILSYPVPLGGIKDLSYTELETHSIRGQINFAKNYNDKHEINTIAGYELRDNQTISNVNRFYGFDEKHAAVSKLNYLPVYPQYNNPGVSTTIPFIDGSGELTDRYLSYYVNGAYSYAKKYTFSSSARLDRSNLFGVNTNQQGVPLYSLGLSWNFSKEDFYGLSSVLPFLKFRLTYGYNGNINKTLSAFTTARFRTGNLINTPFSEISNPPNPELRWERVRIINIGIDFASRNNRISGSFEPFYKRGKDLIGDIAYAPSAGITTFRGNTANTTGRGMDLSLNTINLNGTLKWNTSFMLSVVKDKVTDYELREAATFYTTFAESQVYPLNNRPFYSLYSYKYGGLDPLTGDPLGYLNGEASKEYSLILNDATPDNIVFHGSARPTTFGAIRNTLTLNQFSVSFNISYRFGYYYRERGIFFNSILSGEGYYMGNYPLRWKAPGDEQTTKIPSLPNALNVSRDNFYNYSEATVHKGDHIRIQDISLTYRLDKHTSPKLPFKTLEIYSYVNNIGLLWKSSSSDLDPDFPNVDYPPVKTISLGLKIGL